MKLYGEISKTEQQEDGTLKVWGYASSAAVDSDGETVTSDAMKAALPDYMKFGAVREMHQSSAAGTAIEARVEDDGRTWFGAHVVDPIAVKKVQTGVYKGFSIGGKVLERDTMNKSIVKAIRLVEISLVDRPANPEAVFTCYKADEIDKPEGENVQNAPQADDLPTGEETSKADAPALNGDPAPQAGEADSLQKGVWNVADFAQVLQSIANICCDAQWDAELEGDNSPIPAQLRAWLAAGIELFKGLAEEEFAELLACLKQQAGEVAMAAAASDLEKAGARFSGSTKAALKAAHEACKAADQALAALQYDAAEEAAEPADKADAADDLAKVSSAHDDLLKAVGAAGCPEGAIAADFIKAMAVERDDLKKRVAELEAKPVPPKGALMAIEKADEIDLNKSEVPDEPETNDPVELMKRALSKPLFFSAPNGYPNGRG